jgi:shikimate dehydrogenase
VTLRFGVIGAPVAHSRSPAMHEAAYRALGIDARYERIHVEPDALPAFVAGLDAEGFRGVNVTLPHKGAVIPLLDEVSDAARTIGAVNTITVEDGRLHGDNTDAQGLELALRERGVALFGAEAVVLGAGGAARAATYGLCRAGTIPTVAARRPDAARELADAIGLAFSIHLSSIGFDDAALAHAFARAHLVVQCTSATLGDDAGAQAFADILPWHALRDSAVVTDLVYEPKKTTVLRAAEGRGLRTVDGLGMLVHQGALSFERWLGRRAPIGAMRAAVRCENPN